MSSAMFGNIGVAAFIGAASAIASGLGFWKIHKQEELGDRKESGKTKKNKDS